MIESGRVVGIGRATEERARFVVGADGAHSAVSPYVGAPRYYERARTACACMGIGKVGPAVHDFENYGRPEFGGSCVRTIATAASAYDICFHRAGERCVMHGPYGWLGALRQKSYRKPIRIKRGG